MISDKLLLNIVKPSFIHKHNYLNMCLDYINHSDFEYAYSTLKEVERKINNDILCEKGLLPEGRLHSLCFWFLDIQNNIVGTSRLRPKLNERFLNIGGNIGYDVSPTFRKKGYGTIILKQTLEQAVKIGLDKVLVTCDDDNIGSYKVIENNGGILENKVIDKKTGKIVRRYFIELSHSKK